MTTEPSPPNRGYDAAAIETRWQRIWNDERGTNLIFRKFKNTARVGKNSVSDKVVEISANPDAVFEDIKHLVAGAVGRAAACAAVTGVAVAAPAAVAAEGAGRAVAARIAGV